MKKYDQYNQNFIDIINSNKTVENKQHNMRYNLSTLFVLTDFFIISINHLLRVLTYVRRHCNIKSF